MTALLILIILIALNALFVAAEFALVGAPRHVIEQRAREGSIVAASIHRVLSNPKQQDQYVATAQLGITLASLGLGMYSEHSLALWFIEVLHWAGASGLATAHTLASVCAISVMTYLHIVLGEMVPKSLALLYAERSAIVLYSPMWVARILSYPLVIALNTIGNQLLRVCGVEAAQTASETITLDELRLIVAESGKEGMLHNETTKLLNELFDLTALSAQEVMIPRIHVSGVPLGAQPSEMKAIITADPHTRYPVFQDSIDNIKGMVHIKDLFRLIRAESPLQSKHLRQVLFVPATILLDTLIKRMNIEHTQFAVVVDEHGGTAGIVTLEDVFEEVVGGAGEPQGEGNTALQRRKRRRITGTTRVDELGEMFGIKLEHPEVVTVSGLVMAQLGRPAQVSDQIHYGGLNITVSQVKGLGVAECLVQLAARADDSTKSE